MSDLFASGHAVDLVLLFLVLEVLMIAWARRRSAANAITAALPGVCLLLALRASLTGQGWPFMALWIGRSLPADLMRRPP